ncbi:hypothetical protein [Dactylosporangium sp. NPDC051541]|uniref:hypothetical protein n=1 Tax=Dactylosporangium sp. NPDC051541 TaxID=3363977 RepID=UPI00379F577D
MGRGAGNSAVDAALAWIAGLGVLVVCGGCVFRWSLVVPPDEGAGPYRTPARVHNLHVLLVIVGVAVVLLIARALWADADTPWFTAAALLVIVALVAVGLYVPRAEAQIVADGFGDDWYGTSTEARFTLYNTTGAPVTVCLGLSGDCDSAAKGPDRLRAPGLTIPAGHRLSVDTPSRAGDFKLTITGPGVTHRDAILHTEVPQSTP